MRAREDITTVAATVVPVSVDEFKQHQRIDHSEEDGLVESYLLAAATLVRDLCGRALLNETREAVFSRFDALLWTPSPMVHSVVDVRYLNTAYDTVTVDAAAYHVANINAPWDQCQVMPLTVWPADVADVPDAVRVRYTCGYGATPDTVPEPLRQAVRLLAGHWYEHREDVVVGTITHQIESGFRSLVEPYRFRRMF